MAFDKDVSHVMGGVAAAKIIQALVRKYGDIAFAQMFLYKAEQYVKDLKAAGYVVQVTDTAKTDAEIGQIVVQETGYTFLSGPANLRGAAKLTADPYTYRAAIGQKVVPFMQLSSWGSGVLGMVGIADSMYNFLDMGKYKLMIAAAGASLVSDGVTRGIGVDGTITAPSGFDVSKQPGMQYLDPHAQANVKALAERNSQLQAEVNTLRQSLGIRATGTVQAGAPQVTVTELARNPNEALRQQQFMGTYPQQYPVAPGNIQFMNHIQRLESAFL